MGGTPGASPPGSVTMSPRGISDASYLTDPLAVLQNLETRCLYQMPKWSDRIYVVNACKCAHKSQNTQSKTKGVFTLCCNLSNCRGKASQLTRWLTLTRRKRSTLALSVAKASRYILLVKKRRTGEWWRSSVIHICFINKGCLLRWKCASKRV